MSELPFAALADTRGFRPDQRFLERGVVPTRSAPADPLAEAHALGYAAGAAEADAAAAARIAAALAGREAIELALTGASAACEEALRQRLHATVAALCGEVFAVAARDPEALTKRIAAASALLARADDGRVLRLHPGDIALLGGALPEGLPVEPDPALTPGSLRIEGAHGGVADGPELWQRSLAEALAQC